MEFEQEINKSQQALLNIHIFNYEQCEPTSFNM